MTLEELIDCCSGLKKPYEVFYGIDKKPVDWIHIEGNNIIFLCNAEDEKYWEQGIKNG